MHYGRLAGFIAKRHKRRTRYGWGVLGHSPDRMGLIDLSGIIIRAATIPVPGVRGAECRR